MLSELLVSGTERLLLMLGWERETNAVTRTTLRGEDSSYAELKSSIRNMNKKAHKDDTATNTAMFSEKPTLRPVRAVSSHTPSRHHQAQAWTSASAFDVAPTGTV